MWKLLKKWDSLLTKTVVAHLDHFTAHLERDRILVDVLKARIKELENLCEESEKKRKP